MTQIVAALKSKEIEVWFDAEQIELAQSIPRAMSGGIAASERCLVGWSARAKDSPHVANEIDAFYMKDPDPGRMLFLKLDGTPVPALHAARRYLAAASPEQDAAALAEWARARSGIGEPVPTSEEKPASELVQFPIGPLVPSHVIPEGLFDAYARSLFREEDAQRVIDRAIRFRLDASTNRNIPHLEAADLPDIGKGARAYWWRAFAQAGLHGPRMLAALILAHRPDQFPDDAKKDRATLLLTLRLWPPPEET